MTVQRRSVGLSFDKRKELLNEPDRETARKAVNLLVAEERKQLEEDAP